MTKLASALVVAATVLVGCSSAAPAPPPAAPSGITPEAVTAAVGALDGIIDADLRTTGVPGAAVAVVYRGQVLYSKGFGVRQVGRPEPVDPDTVFQLASVSKAIAGTVVGAAADHGRVAWTDTVASRLPGWTLSDPWVGSHATIADMLAHRSGLPESIDTTDILEDLGFSEQDIFARQALLPLEPFRDSYSYTNFGLTSGGEAAARAAGTTWPDLAQQEIFGPLGMTSTSYRYADLATRPDRAALHKKGPDGAWVPTLTFDVDRQAPAGGASSSVNDLAKWMTMLLAGGKAGSTQVLGDDALNQIWGPQAVREPQQEVGGPFAFYGEGWNVDRDSSDRLVVNHSGAFSTGAATNVQLIPAEQLGIVTLTNGYPEGLPEAINKRFVDQVENGRQTVDWLGEYRKAFASLSAPVDPTDYTRPPAQVAPAQPAAAYVGTYRSDFWGDLVVNAGPDGSLSLTVGPERQTYPLPHYTGDTFFFTPRGESAFGDSGVVFAGSQLTVNAWNKETGLGVFRRV
ncbi:serine hydrolase domain-containing protein [Actinomycetospora termitidis]|uniref:Serine hydrolase domain-containing protein n=1 Tax=Actinomycetospora termitidis TaxID=3053470 RepID=A0ABT7M1N0_9PSEU|nr:serine hydrolase domain-containing protein [Actinomycetospora sp. Odt1-22]MDL5154563.1 serine hydrolase domain-containing protein [Actinomycetospora sp. Odt1-22]